MSDERTLIEILEEHGLSAEMLTGPVMSRRRFASMVGGSLVVLVTLPHLALAADEPLPEARPARGSGREMPKTIGGWLHVDEQGNVTAYAGKVELGQNARTSLSLVVAEELRIPPQSVHMVLGDTALTPFDMGTFGSRTTPYTIPPLRQAAAAARDLLLGLAAEQLGAEPKALVIADGRITNPATGKSLGFGELTKGQEFVQAIPANVTAIPPAQWKYTGKPTLKVDAVATVTGRKKFASDFKRPGMLYGKVLRSGALKTKLKSADTSQAEAMPGVIICRDGDFLGVAAPSEEAAEGALKAIKPEWDHTKQIGPAELYDHLRKTAGEPSRGAVEKGSVETGIAGSDVTLKQTYTVSYVAHSAMEPRSAIAEWNGDALTVWCATQAPFGVQSELAQALRLPQSSIRVIGLDTGVGYGGKTRCPAAIEAARIARVAQKPVRVAWTRAEEQWGTHFRPAGIIDIHSGVKKDGTLVAWEYHNYNSGPPAMATPYEVPNQLVAFHACDSPLPIGAYRALAAPVNIWARETHMDELAVALKMEPLAFRLKNLSDDRLKAVLEAAAKRFRWGRQPGQGHGVGIACGTEKGSFVATCAEVSVDARGKVSVLRLVSAFDCGAVINPLHLRNQMEGGATMALGAALFEAVEFDDGKMLNASFTDYRVPRFSDLPRIEAILVDRKDLPSVGGGETPCCAVGAAVGNAIFNATGVRLRALPMVPKGMPK